LPEEFYTKQQYEDLKTKAERLQMLYDEKCNEAQQLRDACKKLTEEHSFKKPADLIEGEISLHNPSLKSQLIFTLMKYKHSPIVITYAGRTATGIRLATQDNP
jgi:hypothetical protein